MMKVYMLQTKFNTCKRQSQRFFKQQQDTDNNQELNQYELVSSQLIY